MGLLVLNDAHANASPSAQLLSCDIVLVHDPPPGLSLPNVVSVNVFLKFFGDPVNDPRDSTGTKIKKSGLTVPRVMLAEVP